MRRNLEAGGGLVFSQRVLLALTAAGMARDEAYRVVQEHALRALDGGVPFRDGLSGDPRVSGLLPAGPLGACFELDHYLRSVDAIFERTGGPAG
jgi:adenylosuccinate lyase